MFKLKEKAYLLNTGLKDV